MAFLCCVMSSSPFFLLFGSHILIDCRVLSYHNLSLAFLSGQVTCI